MLDLHAALFPVNPLYVGRQCEFSAGMADPASSNKTAIYRERYLHLMAVAGNHKYYQKMGLNFI